MKVLYLLAAVGQLCLVAANAEAEAEAAAESSTYRYSYSYSTGAKQYQTGGPGYNSYSYSSSKQYPTSYSYSSSRQYPSSYSYGMQSGAPGSGFQYQTRSYGASNSLSASDANSLEGYGTLRVQDTGNAMEDTSSVANSGWQSGSASSYLRSAGSDISAAEAEDMSGYGSASVAESGNVETLGLNSNMGGSMNYMNPPTSSYPSPPISSYPSPPISYYPSPPISSNPTPSTPDYVQTSYPLMPVNSRPPYYNNYLPLNNQGQVFTRSYTPLQGSPCMSVCRSRPLYNARPVCNTACNVRPSCPMAKPLVDYAVQGQTTFCKPKPIAVNLPQPIQGCGTPSCGMKPAPQPIYSSGSPCGGMGGYGCGGGGFNPGFDQGSFGDSGFNQGSFGDSGFNPGSFGDSGFNPGSYGDSGFNAGQGQGGFNPGTGCSSGGCGSPQPGCSTGGCGGSAPTYPEQAVNLPAQLGGWSSRRAGQSSIPEAKALVADEKSSEPEA